MTNEDPEYRFLKGIGWVPAVERRYLLQSRDAKVWVIDREPKKGEHGVTYSTTEKDWYDGTGLIPEGPQTYLRGVYFHHCTALLEDWDWGIPKPKPDRKVATIILAEDS